MTRISEAFPKEEKPLSTEEVCRLFDIHPQTANRWRRIGRLPYHETPGGRKVFYLYSEVLEALKQNPSKRKPKAR
ncbi:MAG: helix-turn-helix domain-containing protein [Bacteroidetes bacterium]|nr:helix-turn-helix domain-containing protein [Bacteroidota bacterium]